ncbi:MAG TPA: RES domain-containing protein [Gaiellaceae bacterium]|nr:RES domain-containing protein [Gaiellaceae bacterium]
MILYRCFAWNARVRPDRPDGALWFPRPYQGDGRHDNADLYGCLYLSEQPLSCIVEQLARFRGQRLLPALLVRRGLPLALAELELPGKTKLVDLDDPAVLRREHLRPSRVATRAREVTQPQARALYERHSDASGIRWWSTFEAQWLNVTVFDRAGSALRLVSARALDIADDEIVAAAEVLGLRVP